MAGCLSPRGLADQLSLTPARGYGQHGSRVLYLGDL